jgi:hypothetical protein
VEGPERGIPPGKIAKRNPKTKGFYFFYLYGQCKTLKRSSDIE